MRIAVVSPVFPPYKGGIGHVAEAQANALKALGHQVVVFAPGLERSPSFKEGATGESVVRPLFTYGNASVMPTLFSKLKGFDVIHLHYPCYGQDIFAILASVIYRTPLVLTYHMKTVTNDWRNIIFSWHRRLVEPLIFLVAKKVFVSTLEYAQAAGIKHRDLIEMPFGVDGTRFSPGPGGSLTPLAARFLFVGGLDKAHDFKGVDVLLRAFAKLSGSAKLVIAGDGDRKPFYERLARDLNIAARVTFLGRVSDEELPKVYRSADVHVLPSINGGEAFGLVTLEAAASGLPSVVSDLPGVRTLVVKGQTGYLAKPGQVDHLAERLQKFIDRPEEAVIMGASARSRVMERYDSGAIARELMRAYNECLEG